ncbi:MAG TPA: hypothetical protein VFX97_11565 [Pyrinomonadaceae bacterium]|nr:hypothetical protein [Pyrinomonadaceae bacterium]
MGETLPSGGKNLECGGFDTALTIEKESAAKSAHSKLVSLVNVSDILATL